jgi:hypothetical protein
VPTVTIEGVVQDEARAPIGGARVYFVAAPASVPDVAALTDESGGFSLAAPSPGSYTLEAAADGYAAGRVNVTVAAAAVRVTLELTRQP